MIKTIRWVVIVLLVSAVFVPSGAFCMGWRQPPVTGGGGDTGTVSAPEPVTVTLIGMAVGAGVGYFFGRRKK